MMRLLEATGDASMLNWERTIALGRPRRQRIGTAFREAYMPLPPKTRTSQFSLLSTLHEVADHSFTSTDVARWTRELTINA